MTAPRPLSTSLVDATVGNLKFTAVDVDEIARRVFPRIEGEAAEKIAAELVRARGGEIASLANAYDETRPLRAFPVPPRLTMHAYATPLPENPTLADTTKWTCEWTSEAILEADDLLACDEGRETLLPTRDATAFERALLACHAAEDDELPVYTAILAETPIANVELPPRITANGETSGTITIDICTTTLITKRAVLTRNPNEAPEWVYCVATAQEAIAPFIERQQTITIARDEFPQVCALATQRLEVHFTTGGELPITVPVVLAIAPVEPTSVLEAMTMWLEQQEQGTGSWQLRVQGDAVVLRDVRMALRAP